MYEVMRLKRGEGQLVDGCEGPSEQTNSVYLVDIYIELTMCPLHTY